MQIRFWEAKDIPVLAELEKKCFSDPWTEEMLFDGIKYPYYYGFLAEEEGQVCAYSLLSVLFEDAEIPNIAVDIPYRKRGIAKALMTSMHGFAKEKGATTCFLEVRSSNLAAQKLYEGLGYERYGVRARYYSDGEDAVLMKKDL